MATIKGNWALERVSEYLRASNHQFKVWKMEDLMDSTNCLQQLR